MRSRNSIWAPVILAVILGMAALGGVWSKSYAQITIPTEPPPTSESGSESGPSGTVTPTPIPPLFCVYGTLDPLKSLDLSLPISKIKPKIWGGINTPAESICRPALESLCKIPVNFLPKREQMNYYRMGMEVLQIVNGKVDRLDACGIRDVYFDLTGYERFIYDHGVDRIAIYHFDTTQKAWRMCTDMEFDIEQGDYGRLVCHTPEWGYFALGRQVENKK